MNPTDFNELGLAQPLLRALTDAGYTTPTPIQARAIPHLLAGRDLLGLAETGTGKTAAFSLPLLQSLAAKPAPRQPRSPRALILAPTRELAIQIDDSLATYGRHMGLEHAVLYGGVGQGPQVAALVRGLDILVATPGRLIDLIGQRHCRLDRVSYLVLDEADRMLDMGFIRDVRRIVRLVPGNRQTLLFSATMPADIAELAHETLRSPVRVEIARAGKTVDRVDQRVHFVDTPRKHGLLVELLADPALARVLVFTRTKRGADRVTRGLTAAGIDAHAIHGNKSQGQRQKALDSFKAGGTRVLVATDIAARGIDIDDISHVINYELPNIPESYVHRIGRTARAGSDGIAIALCAPDERAYLRDIERLTRKPLAVVAGGGVAPGAPKGARGPDRDVRNPAGSGHRGSNMRQDRGRSGNANGRKRRHAGPNAGSAGVTARSHGDHHGRQGAPWANWTGKRLSDARPAPRRDHRPSHESA